jgi:S1-C subfamily serine protease
MMQALVVALVAGQAPAARPADFPATVKLSSMKATVLVSNLSRTTEGSGVIIGRKGPAVYILTAHHVIDGAEGLQIRTFPAGTLPDGAKDYRSAEVVAVEKGIRDLALLRLTTTDRMPGSLPLCPPAVVPADGGFQALAVGCGDGKPPTASVDRVIGKKLVRRGAKAEAAYCWEVERKHGSGRSGGPLVSARGYLLGVLSGTNRGKSYFCHTGEIHAFLKRSGYQSLAEGKGD